MAKTGGVPTSITLDNAAGAAKIITNDVTSLSVSTSRGIWEVTGLDKAAMERIPLLADCKLTMKGAFNATADYSHAVISTCILAASANTRTLAIGYPGATLTIEVVIESYDVDRGEDGKLTWSAPMSLAGGVAPAWS
jgi:hypothetical protein